MKTLTVKELYEFLKYKLERDPECADNEVFIPVANSSIGPSAAVGVGEGFDWDHGRIFIRPQSRLSYAAAVDWKSVQDYAYKSIEFIKKHSGHERTRDSVYFRAFIDGVRYGIDKLDQANKEPQK